MATVRAKHHPDHPPHCVLYCTIAPAAVHTCIHISQITVRPARGAAPAHFSLPISPSPWPLCVQTTTQTTHLPACYNARSHRPPSTHVYTSHAGALRPTSSESAGAERGAARAYRMERENPQWEGGLLFYSSLLLSLYCAAGCARSGFYERLGSRGAAVAVYFPLNTLL